jgi:allophanate hydrolase subunit 2
VHTTFLDTFEYSPSAIEVLAPGLATTVQDLPGRNVGLGIPRGGPADMLSFQAANVLVGNTRSTEALEITMIGPKLLFHTDAVIAVTGATMKMTLDGNEVSQWTTLGVKKDQVLHIGTAVGGLCPRALNHSSQYSSATVSDPTSPSRVVSPT